MGYKLKIHEIAIRNPVENDTPITVVFKISEKGDFVTNGEFMVEEVKIPREEFKGLDEAGEISLIQEKIRIQAEEKILKVSDTRNLKKLEGMEFFLSKTEVVEIPDPGTDNPYVN